MSNATFHDLHVAPGGVEKTCEIARQLISIARGTYATEQQCVEAVARRAKLSPSVLRRFLQPSRKPKEVGLTVYLRLQAAYRRQLEHQLVLLRDEIRRADNLAPDDPQLLRLLDTAKTLVRKIEAVTGPRPTSQPD